MNAVVAIAAICAFIGFAIGWLAREAEPMASEEPNETGVWPL